MRCTCTCIHMYIYTCILDWLVSVVARGETQHSLLLTTVNCVVPPTLTLFTNFHSMLHTMLHTLYMFILTFCNNLCTLHTIRCTYVLYTVTFCSSLHTMDIFSFLLVAAYTHNISMYVLAACIGYQLIKLSD